MSASSMATFQVQFSGLGFLLPIRCQKMVFKYSISSGVFFLQLIRDHARIGKKNGTGSCQCGLKSGLEGLI